MELRIEPPNAGIETYSGAPAWQGNGELRVLDLAVPEQGRDNWCWAAIASALGRYYRSSSLSQEQVVEGVLGTASGPESDREALLSDALDQVGCYSHWSPGRPSFERIVTEIHARRPLCVHIDWRHGGSHYALIRGVDPDSREIHVADSRHGSSLCVFDDFPHQYQAGGIWRGTFWTQSPQQQEQISS